MTFSPYVVSKLVFNLLITFRLCSDVEKKDQTSQQERRKVKESQCGSYTTSSSVTPLLHPRVPPPMYVCRGTRRGKTQLGRWGGGAQSCSRGGNHDEKQSRGRMFCSSANRKTEPLFSTLVGYSWKCFLSQSCRVLAVLTLDFCFAFNVVRAKPEEPISSIVTLLLLLS